MVGLSIFGILVIAGVDLSALRDNLRKDRKAPRRYHRNDRPAHVPAKWKPVRRREHAPKVTLPRSPKRSSSRIPQREIGHNFQEAARVTGKLSSNIVDVDEADGKTGSAADQVLASAEQRRPRGIT
jgi:hypothetical protein